MSWVRRPPGGADDGVCHRENLGVPPGINRLTEITARRWAAIRSSACGVVGAPRVTDALEQYRWIHFKNCAHKASRPGRALPAARIWVAAHRAAHAG